MLILGQDPYHGEHQAHGLCFSVEKSQPEIPPSLVNIYKELQDDLGCKIPNNGCLTKWADQGVLLLNTVLTVRAHQANSHQGRGWEQFTDAVIRAVTGQTGTEQDPDAHESQTSGADRAASEPVICLPGIFRMPSFQ